MQANQDLSSCPSINSYRDEDEFVDTVAKFTHDFNRELRLENSRSPLKDVKTSTDGEDQQETQLEQAEEGRENEVDDDEEEEEDFTFMCFGEGTSPIAADKVFQDGQILPMFPLFNRDLLFADDVSVNRFPIRPPVDKIFIESPRGSSPSPSESNEADGVAAGPYCSWSKKEAPEVCKKSNSTGFSKLWRFKDKISRSNSDGRDAFVFLNGSTTSSSTKGEDKTVSKMEVSSEKVVSARERPDQKKTAVDARGKVKKGGKAKAKSLSAHEVYLRNKGSGEEDRRRSYLPYRPELMGFFTNVNGGLSRNVHPF